MNPGIIHLVIFQNEKIHNENVVNNTFNEVVNPTTELLSESLFFFPNIVVTPTLTVRSYFKQVMLELNDRFDNSEMCDTYKFIQSVINIITPKLLYDNQNLEKTIKLDGGGAKRPEAELDVERTDEPRNCPENPLANQ